MPVSQGMSTVAMTPSVTLASISSHDMPASAVTTYVAGCDHDAVPTFVVCHRMRDHLPGRIGVAWDLLGNGDVDVRGRLVLALFASGLDGTLRAHLNQARDSRLGLGRRLLVAATGEHEDPGGKGGCPNPRHVDETAKGAWQFRVPPGDQGPGHRTALVSAS